MTWDEFLETARAVGNAAAEKIGKATENAATQIKIANAEAKLKAAYTEFGKSAYRHFTADASEPSDPQILAEQVKKIALLQAEVEKLKSGSTRSQSGK